MNIICKEAGRRRRIYREPSPPPLLTPSGSAEGGGRWKGRCKGREE